MNKLIEQQLKKLKVAEISSYDELKNTYTFKKHQSVKFNVNAFYMLELNDTLLDPANNDLLIGNWNGGRCPTHKYLKAQVTTILGKMLYLTGVYCDADGNQINEHWAGWLPDDQLKMIKEV